jgi:hypothetical protein
MTGKSLIVHGAQQGAVVEVNQTGASALGDIVGHDKIETHNHYPARAPVSVVEQLLAKLQLEIENNESIRHTIESLAYFHTHRSHDGADGLEAKLTKGYRTHEYFHAIEKKELFVKLLERWSLYASAQEIFAYLLAKAEHEFSYFVHPQIAKLDQATINQMIHDRIVVPTINECGATVFTLNHGVAMGMVYWLAEQCFVRWHQ